MKALAAMTPVRWMVGMSVASWLVVAAWVERESGVAVLFGMLGPLMIVAGTWWLTERTFRRRPERVTSMMLLAFAGKMLFVAAYVVVMLGGLAIRPVPFVASFTTYFVVLYAMEALYLRRLFAGALDDPR